MRSAQRLSPRSGLHLSSRALVIGLGSLLLLLALLQMGWGVLTILAPGEVMYGEAIIHDQAARIARGEPLYQPLDRPPYSVAAYTPLYYMLAAAFQAVFGPGFVGGRLLSFFAGLVTAGLVAYLAAARLADVRAGLFAAVLFLALGLSGGLTGFPPWSALYKQDVLGVALSLGSLAVLAGGTTTRRIVLAAILAGLAFMTKQTFVAAGLAGVIWLWRRDRNKATIFTAAGLPPVLAISLALENTTSAFLANTVFANANPFQLDALLFNLGIYSIFQSGPVAVAVLHLARKHSSSLADELVVLFWLASLLPLLGLAKVGSNYNYWIEFAAATSVLATLGLWSRLKESGQYVDRRGAGVPTAMIAINLIAAACVVLTSIAQTIGTPGPASSRVEFSRAIERVRDEPRQVLASPVDLVALAGRPLLLEPYIFSILYSEGRWDPGPLVRRICAGDVGLLVVDRRLDSAQAVFHGYAHWPAPILSALRDTMVLESELAGRFFYAPRVSSDGVCKPGAA